MGGAAARAASEAFSFFFFFEGGWVEDRVELSQSEESNREQIFLRGLRSVNAHRGVPLFVVESKQVIFFSLTFKINASAGEEEGAEEEEEHSTPGFVIAATAAVVVAGRVMRLPAATRATAAAGLAASEQRAAVGERACARSAGRETERESMLRMRGRGETEN